LICVEADLQQQSSQVPPPPDQAPVTWPRITEYKMSLDLIFCAPRTSGT